MRCVFFFKKGETGNWSRAWNLRIKFALRVVFELNFALSLDIILMFAIFGFCISFPWMSAWDLIIISSSSLNYPKHLKKTNDEQRKEFGTKVLFLQLTKLKTHRNLAFPMRIAEWIDEDELNLIVSCNGN